MTWLKQNFLQKLRSKPNVKKMKSVREKLRTKSNKIQEFK